MSPAFDIVSHPDGISIVKPSSPPAWEFKVELPAETYSRDEVEFVVREIAEYLSDPGDDFTICAKSTTRASPAYAEAKSVAANPSASSRDGVSISADAFRYATVAELAPHCFAQAELRFHNLTVIRRDGDETELLLHVADAKDVRFVLQPEARDALVAALVAPA